MFGASMPIAALAVALAAALSACGQSSTKTVTRTVQAPGATSTAPAASKRAACGSVAGNFITHIETLGVDCPTARRVARKWLAGVQRGSNPAKPIDVAGYRCAARFHGQRATGLCERGGDPSRGRIVFSAHP